MSEIKLPSLIELKDLYKLYEVGDQQVKALNGVNLSISQGELLSIVGPSGAGKSTLMDMIGLLDTPTSGEIFFNGQALSKFDDNKRSDMRNREIGFAFQSFFLLSSLTAIQNVSLPLSYRSISHSEIQKKATAILQKVGLGDRLDHKPNELSGGQQQRVAIARALVTKPKIMLADEPTGSLDSETGAAIIKLLKILNKEDNVTTIIVTHDDQIAMECPRQIHIKDGKLTDSAQDVEK